VRGRRLIRGDAKTEPTDVNRSRGAIGAVVLCVLVSACGGAGAPPTALPSPTAESPPSAIASPSAPAPTSSPTAAVGTLADIAALRDRLANSPDDPDTLRALGLALLQRVRETADPSLYAQAEEALTRAQKLAPDDPLALVGIGGLQLGRHQFAAALETARQTLVLDPALEPAKAVEVDALVELGRYDEAIAATQELLALRVDITSLARVSYLRELHGNLDGAIAAMRQASESPALAPENTAYVTTLLGNLLVYAGKPDEAAASYESVLRIVPDHAAAIAGLGRLAVGRGDLEEATRRFKKAAAILPLPEYVIALGETREAAGDAEAAAESYDLARAETALFQAAGVDVDLELAIFEADHGDATVALRLAEQSYATRQTVRTADALAWANHRAGHDIEAVRLSKEALRLGGRDPLLIYHAGMIALATGDEAGARLHLTDALAIDPGFSATGAAAAREALAGLG
jgi:tetratricopeptide (TPR) repeat protein